MSTLQFRCSALHFYQFWWSYHRFCVGQLLLDSLSTHSIHNLPTCTQPTQKLPPGGIGHARAKVSWFRILPDCLCLSLLEKELQVSYRETPHFSALWKENLISKYIKNISLDNTLSYVRGILILSIKQCKGVSPVESHIPKHGIWLTIRKTRAFQNLSDLLRCLWTRSFSVTEDARAWKQCCGHISESIASQSAIPGQLTQGQSSLFFFVQILHWDVQLTLLPSVQFWNLPFLMKTTVLCSLGV